MQSTATRQLHPVFAEIAKSFIDAPRLARQAQVDAYIALLKAQDWSSDFSDDPSVYRRGRESLANLRMVQRELDPEFLVWNQHCDPACVGGRSYR